MVGTTSGNVPPKAQKKHGRGAELAEVSEDSRAARPPARNEPRTGRNNNTRPPEAAGRLNKAGRPKEMEGTTIVSLRLPAALVSAVDDIVARSGFAYRDRSQFLRSVVTDVVMGDTRPVEVEEAKAAKRQELVKFTSKEEALAKFGAAKLPHPLTKTRRPTRLVKRAK